MAILCCHSSATERGFLILSLLRCTFPDGHHCQRLNIANLPGKWLLNLCLLIIIAGAGIRQAVQMQQWDSADGLRKDELQQVMGLCSVLCNCGVATEAAAEMTLSQSSQLAAASPATNMDVGRCSDSRGGPAWASIVVRHETQ